MGPQMDLKVGLGLAFPALALEEARGVEEAGVRGALWAL